MLGQGPDVMCAKGGDGGEENGGLKRERALVRARARERVYCPTAIMPVKIYEAHSFNEPPRRSIPALALGMKHMVITVSNF